MSVITEVIFYQILKKTLMDKIILWLLKNFRHREICANEFAQLILGAPKCCEIFFWKSNNVGFLMNELPKKSDLRLYKIPWMTHGGDPV